MSKIDLMDHFPRLSKNPSATRGEMVSQLLSDASDAEMLRLRELYEHMKTSLGGVSTITALDSAVRRRRVRKPKARAGTDRKQSQDKAMNPANSSTDTPLPSSFNPIFNTEHSSTHGTSAPSTSNQVLALFLRSLPELELVNLFPRLLTNVHETKGVMIALVLLKASQAEMTALMGLYERTKAALGPILSGEDAVVDSPSSGEFPIIPDAESISVGRQQYLKSTSNAALRVGVCAVCAQETPALELRVTRFGEFPEELLYPLEPHEAMQLVEGCLLHKAGIIASSSEPTPSFQVCGSCRRQLDSGRMPHLSLARGAWVGDIPPPLTELTMAEELLIGLAISNVFVVKLRVSKGGWGAPDARQSALRGTCSTYRQNIPEIVEMLEDRLLPLPPSIFLHTLSIAFIGSKKISKESLRFFAVRRAKVHAALLWLKHNNPYYFDFDVSEERLLLLPVNDVPDEIISLMRYSGDLDSSEQEESGYAPQPEQGTSVEDQG